MGKGEIIVPQNVTLEVIKGDDQGQKYNINNKTMSIGRAQNCDIRLTDKYTSNKHCQVVFRNGHFTVIDLGSSNKTRVNNTVYVQKNLRNNDIIRVGKTEMRFNWDDLDEKSLDAIEDILGQDNDDALRMEDE